MRLSNIPKNQSKSSNKNLNDQKETNNIQDKIWHEIKTDMNGQTMNGNTFLTPLNTMQPQVSLNGPQGLFPTSNQFSYYPLTNQNPYIPQNKIMLQGNFHFHVILC